MDQSVFAGLSPYQKLVRLAAQVRPGMSRHQVDRLFPHSKGGIQGQFITIYNEIPGGRIEITFDHHGGAFSNDNRVTHPPQVFMTINW